MYAVINDNPGLFFVFVFIIGMVLSSMHQSIVCAQAHVPSVAGLPSEMTAVAIPETTR